MGSRMTLRIALAMVLCAPIFAFAPDADAETVKSDTRSMSVKRSSREAPGTDLEEYAREKAWRDREAAREEERRDRLRREEEEEEERENPRGPSTGPSCMYAADGTLVFAPRGRACAGAANAAPATPKPRSRAASDNPNRRSGSCMRGGDGKVIYAPPGVDCGD